MPNLRIVYDNAADRATISASSTAGSLTTANLLSDIKSNVWRSVGTTATLTVTWPSAETVSCVVLPFCNFTSTSTIRARCYTTIGDLTPVFDTGTVLASPYAPFGLWNWGISALGVNAYSYGGGTYAIVWFAPQSVKELVIDIVDVDNTAGYVEVSRLVTGAYWSPLHNANWSPGLSIVDSSTNQRNDAGDLLTNQGTKHRKISCSLNWLSPTERATLVDIFVVNGITRPLFFSLFPESTDPVQEQSYQLYCKLTQNSQITYPYMDKYSAPLELEEI